jgi:hypothetical protein
MSARQENFAVARSAGAIHSSNNPTTAPSPREGGRDPLCSEDLDAQIRWFFEHAVQQQP